MFFVLSGFLIGSILLRNIDSQCYYRTFYIRRAFRILPIYAVVIVICTALFSGRMPWWVHATFSQCVFVSFAAAQPFLEYTWSLSVEEWFYLVAPLTIRKARRFVPAICIAAVLVCPVLRWFFLRFIGQSAAYCLVFGRVDALGAGIFIATAAIDGTIRKLIRRARLLAVICGLVNFALCFHGWDFRSALDVVLGLSTFPLFFAAVLTLVVTEELPNLATLLRNPHLMLFGKVSYCIYLIHIPAWRIALAIPFGGAARLLIAVSLTLVLADLSWRYLESRMIARGQKYSYDMDSAVLKTAV